MNRNLSKTKIIGTVVGLGLLAALPVAAQTGGNATSTSASAGGKITAKMEKARSVAAREVDRRVAAMNALVQRLGQMKKLSDSDKATLKSQLQTQTGDLQTLLTKINADSDAATLQTDVKSITDAYRIFALIMPRDAIIAAADRVASTVDILNSAGTKLNARLNDPQYAGNDLTALKSALQDMQTKLVDANTQAQNAINLIVPLVPDNGDKTVMASNTATLKTARADIKTGSDDLKAAIKDAQTIVKGLKSLKPVSVQSTSTTTTSTTTGQ